MQVRFGSNKPATAPFAANDYGTGLMACYAVALALLHRRRTGKGQFVDSALAYTATMLQSALLQGHKGKEWNEPHGQEATGSGPLNRLYQASDGWFFLAARAQNVANCTDLADLVGRTAADLERELERRMRSRSIAAWVELLNKAGIGAHRVIPTLPELMTDPLTTARGLAITRDHEGFGPITTHHHHGAGCAAFTHAGKRRTTRSETRIGCSQRAGRNRDAQRAGTIDSRRRDRS
jgi:crotonobetainyl-CoA:carnitine CoA-transferase CaiB-like acyl-CoA transferase